MPLTAQQLRDELQYRLSERTPGGLRAYIKAAWPILEPVTPLAWGWYHDAMCNILEAVTTGDVRKVIINIPPRHSKSTIVSVGWPTWVWGPRHLPHTRWLFTSYVQSRSLEDAMRRRRIFGSPWYLAGWGDTVRIGADKWTTDGSIRYSNSATGHHFATSVKGSNTGEGGDIIVVDDPHNMKEIHSDTVRESVLEWWRGTMSTRLNQQATGRIVHVAQRGHEMDLCGYLLSTDKEYVHLNLPAEFIAGRRCRIVSPAGKELFVDPRVREGEVLDPIRHPPSVLATLKIQLGDAYEPQFQQNAVPAEGGIIKRSWFRYWVPPMHPLVGQPDVNGRPILPLPNSFELFINSWDCAFKDEEKSSYVVGQAWGKRGTKGYLLAQRRDKMDFTETQYAVAALTRDCPPHRPHAVYVEDRANGTAILNSLRDVVDGLLPADVDSSKIARAHAVSPRCKAGTYVLPHPALDGYEWVAGPHDQWAAGHLEAQSWLHEITMAPNAAYWDQTDAFTQADRYLFQSLPFDEQRFQQ